MKSVLSAPHFQNDDEAFAWGSIPLTQVESKIGVPAYTGARQGCGHMLRIRLCRTRIHLHGRREGHFVLPRLVKA